MPTGLTTDTLSASRFTLSVDGIEIGQFDELSGITSEIEPVDFIENSQDQVVINKQLGKRKPPTITLTRGKSGNLQLWAWHDLVLQGQIAQAQKDGKVIVYDIAGNPAVTYKLTNAWPAKIALHGLNLEGNTEVHEALTLVCEDIQRVV